MRAVVAFAAVAVALAAVPSSYAAAPHSLVTHGIKVSWPAGDALYANSEFTTTVRSARARVTLVLARTTRFGKVMEVVGRKTLRNGTFSVRLPYQVGSRYRLTISAGARSWEHEWATMCGEGGTPRVEASVTPSSARSGDVVRLRLHNSGTSCLRTASSYEWQRQAPDGTWQVVPEPGSQHLVQAAFYVFRPGLYSTEPVWVWPVEAGNYRIAWNLGDAGIAVPFVVLP